MKTITLLIFLSFLTTGFTQVHSKISDQKPTKKTMNSKDKDEISNPSKIVNQKTIPFLTFQKNDAEQAMNFYVNLFENSKIIHLQRWGKDGPGKEGTVMHAEFELNGQRFMCSDSPPIHNGDFTPAVSNYVVCETEAELERLFTTLSENRIVAMPLDTYGFSKKFGWVIDQFGVSWQLNLP